MTGRHDERWSAPGSLLIAGEYLVTEEGGSGLALAAGGRAQLRIESASLEMEGRRAGKAEYWTPSNNNNGSLASAVWIECSKNGNRPAEDSRNEWYHTPGQSPGPGVAQATPCSATEPQGMKPCFPCAHSDQGSYRRREPRNDPDRMNKFTPLISLGNKLTVDTDIFYDGQGRKLGFGSSAAAALLYTRGLCASLDIEQVAGSALRAHRKWQGGRGSGYDILTSAYGGAGHFTGGIIPSWSPLQWPKGLNSWIIKGPGPVNSPQAVDRYRAWKQKLGIQWDRIPVIVDLLQSVLEAYQFLSSVTEPDPRDFLEILNRMAVRGSRLGNELGVPAIPVIPDGFSNNTKPWYRPGAGASKCLGAGDEIILLMTLPDGLSRTEEAVLRKLMLNGNAVLLRTETAGLKREGPS